MLFIVLAALIHWRAVRDRPGLVSAVFLAGYALARMGIEQFRQPDDHLGFIFAEVTMGQILSVPMIIGALILVVWAFTKGRLHSEPITINENTESNDSA